MLSNDLITDFLFNFFGFESSFGCSLFEYWVGFDKFSSFTSFFCFVWLNSSSFSTEFECWWGKLFDSDFFCFWDDSFWLFSWSFNSFSSLVVFCGEIVLIIWSFWVRLICSGFGGWIVFESVLWILLIVSLLVESCFGFDN